MLAIIVALIPAGLAVLLSFAVGRSHEQKVTVPPGVRGFIFAALVLALVIARYA